jgi:hypothetical protein
MKLEAKRRLQASLGPDKDYTNVGNRLLRALRRADPKLGPPKMSHTSDGYTYTFQPSHKLSVQAIAGALVALAPDHASFFTSEEVVVFHCDTPVGVQYQEVFKIVSNDDEAESRLFQISLKDK